MATQLQLRRGTNTQMGSFTGAEGELAINTTNDSAHVHDGSTAGGHELARADFNNISASATLTLGTLNTTNLDLTNLEVTNIKAKDGTAAGSIADSTGVVTITSAVLTTADITTLKIGSTTVTSTAAELNILDGVTATATELNYVDGVTSAIQTQLDAKAALAGASFTGNVGIGLTPHNWAVGSALELGFEGNALWGNAADEIIVVQNGYYDGAWKYATTRKATHYSQYDGTHRWLYAPSGTADSALTWATAMTIDSGKVGIGTSSPSSYFSGATDLVLSGSGDSGLTVASGTSNVGRIHFADGTSGDAEYRGYLVYGHSNDSMQFGTAGVERMRLDSAGHAIIPAGVTLGTSVGTYAAANTISDYEEGTLTFGSIAGHTNVTGTPTQTYALYTKVGRLIHIQAAFAVNPTSTGKTAIHMTTPFAMHSGSNVGLIGLVTAYPYATENAAGYILDFTGANDTQIYIETNVNNTAATSFYVQLTYSTL